jgi:hypothetical protein
MRPLFVILAFLSVLASGFWAYRENYATKQLITERRALNTQITSLREGIAVQRAEWAYLNRPNRLAELVEVNFDRLRLMPMEPRQFAPLGALPDRPPEMPEISDTFSLTATPADEDDAP